MRNWMLGIIASSLLFGCAVGNTEFRVIRRTPEPTPIITPTPVMQKEQVVESEPTRAVEPVAEPMPPVQSYTVQEGDSLWRISRRLYNDPLKYVQIAKANQITNPDLIQPGQELNLESIPGARLSRQAVLSPGAAPKTAAAPAVAPVAGSTVQPTPTVVGGIPNRPNHAFGPGEKLTFSVEYFGVSAGYATLSVQTGPLFNNRSTLHLCAAARTHPAFEWFFKVRDQIDSFFDTAGLFPWKYEKHLREGNYSADSAMMYNQLQKKIVMDEGRTTRDAQPWTQDVLSEFYYFRTLDLKIGDEVSFPVFADDGKSYELVVKVLHKETVSVPAGKFDCVVVQPLLKFEGLFQSKGKIELWLTDDKRKVPVLIKSAIVIGTIDIVLRSADVVE